MLRNHLMMPLDCLANQSLDAAKYKVFFLVSLFPTTSYTDFGLDLSGLANVKIHLLFELTDINKVYINQSLKKENPND